MHEYSTLPFLYHRAYLRPHWHLDNTCYLNQSFYHRYNVSDRDPAHSGEAAHYAQPAQKLLLEIVDLSNWSEIKNGVSRYIGKVVQKVICY